VSARSKAMVTVLIEPRPRGCLKDMRLELARTAIRD
jgi:hypothetical protein